MVITVTLNPCIDRTVQVEGFVPGKTNRVSASRCDAAGKGINVSAALKNLGEDTRCLGFNFRESGDFLPRALCEMGLSGELTEVGGTLRTNIKIFDAGAGVMTELNEAGAEVGPDALEEFERTLERNLPKASLLVLDGSAPPGVPQNYYRLLAERAERHGVRTVIDAGGELLLEGIKGSPYLIKPNRDELEEAFGERIASRTDALRAARRVVKLGVGMVCVSLGKEGALLVTEDDAWFSAGADVPVRGLQGAGDSMVAGMSYALVRGMPIPEVLRYGVAAAHGSLVLEGTRMCTRKGFLQMLPLISVEKIE
ncbi:1-phosphofructokinase [Caproicibacter sp.]|uniref:1-phosphofructokinase n=1 Tax=Caproicibacter sp. TaxID=2814884 RepID=UPI003988E8FA